MSSSIECQVCRREIPLWSALASDPWLPVVIWCRHCESRYGLKKSSSWRWFWSIAPIAAAVCVFPAMVAFAAVGSLLADLVAVIAGFAGFASIVYLALWSQVVLVRRLYQGEEFEVLGVGISGPEVADQSHVRCGTCGESSFVASACCPMCGVELATTALVPIVCFACGEHVRIAEVCCPACRSPVGDQADVTG